MNAIFSGPIINLLSLLCVLMKILSHASAKKKTKRLKGFEFHIITGLFSSYTMAEKGLITPRNWQIARQCCGNAQCQHLS